MDMEATECKLRDQHISKIINLKDNTSIHQEMDKYNFYFEMEKPFALPQDIPVYFYMGDSNRDLNNFNKVKEMIEDSYREYRRNMYIKYLNKIKGMYPLTYELEKKEFEESIKND